MANLYIIDGHEVKAASLDDTIAELAEHYAGKEFDQFPNISDISQFHFTDLGGDEVELELPSAVVRKYESDLHNAIEAAIRDAKAESKFQSSMINDYKMGRI